MENSLIIEEEHGKLKTIKVRIPLKSNESKKEKESVKKVFKVATKVNEKSLIDKSLEKDFELEEGDPIAFLKERKNHYEEMGYIKRESISRVESVSRVDSVGSAHGKLLELSKRQSEVSSPFATKREFRKRITMKHAFIGLIENEIQIASTIEDINKRIQEGKILEQQKIHNLKPRDKLTYFKQRKSLLRFEKTMKKWNKIELGLTKKSSKSSKELISNKHKSIDLNEPPKHPDWCITLRKKPSDQRFESFIPVGHKLSGIYVRDVINVNPYRHLKTRSCPDLFVSGTSKLPLEINAVRQAGTKILKKEKKDDECKEEVFVENYDFNNKFYKLIS